MENSHPQRAVRPHCREEDAATAFSKAEVERSIPERFGKVARRYPDRPAVKMGNRLLSYAELDMLSSRVAQALLAAESAGPEAVGLFLEKDASLIASMLGVLKAGKFFVLLDPSFPKARIAAMLDDSKAQSVIAARDRVSLVAEAAGAGCRLLEFESVDEASAALAAPGIGPKAFAAIVYTSGSTGQPKGVVWDHRDLLHRILLRTRENRVCAHDRIALLPTGTANVLTNVFLALLNGAVVLPFDVQGEGAIRLAGWLLQEAISICPISSPLFRSLCETLNGGEKFPDLRIIRLRSETVYKTDVDLYKQYFPPTCTFLTGLSTSETGQLTTYLVDHDTEIAGAEVPLGYAVEDKEVLLLDDAGRELGFDQVGEIAAKSRHLAPGYWRRPELTEAKFKSDPDGGDLRLCRTGDLGLMLPDGCLIYKGRKDFRVKVRGYGVEYAEVEKAVLEHAAIKEAVVMARENRSGESRLVAYFTSPSGPPPTVSELRAFLRERLPDYMIPTAFVTVNAMPLTSNGKVDRRALPDPQHARPELDTPWVAPATFQEERLIKIWTEALGLDRIGIHDDFFDLGGDSLSAMRAISKIRDDMRVELPLRRFLETPTVAALAERIGKTSEQDSGEILPIEPVPRAGPVLPSFAQQRLWFLNQLEPESAAYNLFSASRLIGPLNATVFERSFNEIIRRHEALRTVFTAVDGAPFQSILPSMAIKVPVVDLRGIVSEREQASEVRRLSTAEARRPFDLARGPLLRATLLRLAEDDYRLLLAIHHIVFDGWSRGILAQELSLLYAAFSNGKPSPLQELSIQYADFAAWQRQSLQGKVLDTQLAYWKKRLDGISTIQLPTDRPRPAIQRARGARQRLELPQALAQSLKALSRREKVTLFMTLLAAFQTLLYRHTGQNDIAIGSPITGRNRSELHGLIGFFLNMLVLRTDLSGSPTFRELLARVRQVALGAYAHQDMPFEKLVEELHLERNLSRNPLFQVTFSLQNSPTVPLGLAGLAARDLDVEPGIARFDLHLLMEEQATGLRGYMDYNTDLFDGATITRMLSHFQTLLQGIAGNPDERIERLPLLTQAERHQLLTQWNGTKSDFRKDKCIHELFEEQVERSPNAVAVVFPSTALRTAPSTGSGYSGNEQLTYGELNRRANRLAHYLQKFGVGPDVSVGICTERSLETVVGILGILKAGGAYVPLDPACPKERFAFMLEDAQLPVLLIQRRLLQALPEHRAKTVCLDKDWELIAHEPDTNPSVAVTVENLAYVIYTSGSTGEPKGVAVPHRAVNRLVINTDYIDVRSADIVAQAANCSFDAATFEIWGALLHGARLVMIATDVALSPESLAAELRRQNVTVLFLTTALFNQAARELPAAFREVRCLMFGGEAVDPKRVGEILEHGPPERLLHVYGPTETTTFASWCHVENIPEKATTVPIGRPIANTAIYILDGCLRPVPIGVAGELHIGGDGLAREYLNRPELTAEKFIANPFSHDPGARLYKTGDLGRRLPDGNIEFLGRLDHQVKIRGFRVEPGEIEAALSRHPAVREAVVLAREDVPSEKQLVSYVALNRASAATAGELRSFLKATLPDYMIPVSFVFLDTLPLTQNGKVDRKALPAPDGGRPELEAAFVAPRTPIEERVAGIWADLLKIEKVGMHDSFFDLGGHSLLATQVVSRLRDVFHIEVPLQSLFETPTVAALAVQIAQSEAKNVTPAEMADVLDGLESLSDSEAKRLLADERAETRTVKTYE